MNLGLISSPILWNQSVDLIMPVCIFIQIWMSMGTGFLVFMAGLQNANQELYEAGAIDGIKGRFAELFYITLPQMKPQLLFGAINTIAGSFGVFDVISSFAASRRLTTQGTHLWRMFTTTPLCVMKWVTPRRCR